LTEQKGQKLNQLQRLVPEGLLVDATWMQAHGYSRSLLSQYVASGWLEHPGRGIYRRPSGELQWQHIVISLQSLLDIPVVVGGRSALELQGFAHYIPVSPSTQEVHLYSDKPLGEWTRKIRIDTRFEFHNARRLFRESSIPSGGSNLNERTVAGVTNSNDVDHIGFIRQSWGQWNWPLTSSAPERAILELLDQIPRKETFHQVDMMMEGLRTLRPNHLQILLEDCHSVKVKRLFFWFAERHGFSWLTHIDKGPIDFGTGKRMVVPGGKLDKEYLITVPKDLYGV